MFADPRQKSVDPRSTLSPSEIEAASIQAAPRVAQAGKGGDLVVLGSAALVALALGVFTLTSLSAGRTAPVVAPDAELPVTQAVDDEGFEPSSEIRTGPQMDESASTPPGPPPAPTQPLALGGVGPLVIDNSVPTAVAASRAEAAPSASAAPTAGTPNELFASRLGGQDRVVRAQRLANPGFTVIQGSLIPAVLETALNSDLPGYVRAIVSRDVRGFDGARVLIPRGSRLIGEYKSGLANGQARAHIVWTRLVRPDGVSIDLGSPGTDETGQTGIGGQVDRHVGLRYGPAALLSLVSGLASSLGGSSSSTVVVGSTASGAASQALQTDSQIPPTIRLSQGTPIQVFAARDLDFSAS